MIFLLHHSPAPQDGRAIRYCSNQPLAQSLSLFLPEPRLSPYDTMIHPTEVGGNGPYHPLSEPFITIVWPKLLAFRHAFTLFFLPIAIQ